MFIKVLTFEYGRLKDADLPLKTHNFYIWFFSEKVVIPTKSNRKKAKTRCSPKSPSTWLFVSTKTVKASLYHPRSQGSDKSLR